nr:unnamed protein product [Callosobruchus analis]
MAQCPLRGPMELESWKIMMDNMVNFISASTTLMKTIHMKAVQRSMMQLPQNQVPHIEGTKNECVSLNPVPSHVPNRCCALTWENGIEESSEEVEGPCDIGEKNSGLMDQQTPQCTVENQNKNNENKPVCKHILKRNESTDDRLTGILKQTELHPDDQKAVAEVMESLLKATEENEAKEAENCALQGGDMKAKECVLTPKCVKYAIEKQHTGMCTDPVTFKKEPPKKNVFPSEKGECIRRHKSCTHAVHKSKTSLKSTTDIEYDDSVRQNKSCTHSMNKSRTSLQSGVSLKDMAVDSGSLRPVKSCTYASTKSGTSLKSDDGLEGRITKSSCSCRSADGKHCTCGTQKSNPQLCECAVGSSEKLSAVDQELVEKVEKAREEIAVLREELQKLKDAEAKMKTPAATLYREIMKDVYAGGRARRSGVARMAALNPRSSMTKVISQRTSECSTTCITTAGKNLKLLSYPSRDMQSSYRNLPNRVGFQEFKDAMQWPSVTRRQTRSVEMNPYQKLSMTTTQWCLPRTPEEFMTEEERKVKVDQLVDLIEVKENELSELQQRKANLLIENQEEEEEEEDEEEVSDQVMRYPEQNPSGYCFGRSSSGTVYRMQKCEDFATKYDYQQYPNMTQTVPQNYNTYNYNMPSRGSFADPYSNYYPRR